MTMSIEDKVDIRVSVCKYVWDSTNAHVWNVIYHLGDPINDLLWHSIRDSVRTFLEGYEYDNR
jgi:hypothetical protein